MPVRRDGWPRQNLAAQMQIDARHVRRIEAGDDMAVFTPVKLAIALDVEVGALFAPASNTRPRRPGRPRATPTRG